MNRSAPARILIACCLLLALPACGNKGPLFLPEAEAEEVEKKESVNESESE